MTSILRRLFDLDLPAPPFSVDWLFNPDDDDDEECGKGFEDPSSWEPGDQDDDEE